MKGKSCLLLRRKEDSGDKKLNLEKMLSYSNIFKNFHLINALQMLIRFLNSCFVLS